MIENGLDPELLLGGKYGHQLHFWDLHAAPAHAGDRSRRRAADGARAAPVARSDQGLRLRRRRRLAQGSVRARSGSGTATAAKWDVQEGHRDSGGAGRSGAAAAVCSRASARCRRSSPTSISRSTTSISTCRAGAPARSGSTTCRDPFEPKLVGSVRIGGIVARAAHPANPSKPLNGGPQMVEISRDGRRVYFTNSLYRAWDEQFYPDGIDSWMVKLDVDPSGGDRVRPRVLRRVRRSIARTRSACRAATRRRTRTATRELRRPELEAGQAVGSASRAQPSSKCVASCLWRMRTRVGSNVARSGGSQAPTLTATRAAPSRRQSAASSSWSRLGNEHMSSYHVTRHDVLKLT